MSQPSSYTGTALGDEGIAGQPNPVARKVLANVQEMLSAASPLQMEGVQTSCCDHLKQQLDASNCLGIHDLAKKYSRPDLVTAANDFTLNAFEEVFKNDEFLQLPVDRLVEIISDDRLNVKSEEHVYEAVMRWISYTNIPDDEDRINHLADVLKHVRFSQLNPMYLVELSRNPLIKSREDCRENIEEAKDYLFSYQFQRVNGDSREVPDRFNGEQYRPRIRCYSGEKLYVVGGSVGNSLTPKLERYDPETNSWTRLADMNQPRASVGVGALNKVLYAIGGKDHEPYGHLKSIESCKVDTSGWTSDVIAPLSYARSFIGVATLNRFLYVIGGNRGICPLNLVEKYDPISNRWSTCEPLQTARVHHGVATLDGSIYVLGGSGPDKSYLDTLERYDPDENRWQSLAPMMTARENFGCAAFGGYIYAVGGRANHYILASVERYDPSKDIWEWMPSMNGPRISLQAAFLNGLLYAVGGWYDQHHLDTVEVYDPDQKKWSYSAPMPSARADFSVAVSK